MKKIIGIFVLLFTAGICFAQEIKQENVPAVVLNAFYLEFPNAENVEWKLEKGTYNVEFKVNSKLNRLTMDGRGRKIRHEQDLYVSEIPKAVIETLESRVAFFDIHDADKFETAGSVEYDINYRADGKRHDFRLDRKGRLLWYREELKNSEIPDPILSFIRERYGSMDVENAEYLEKSGKETYRLEGEIKNNDHSFIFDTGGRLLSHTEDIKNSAVPSSIMNTVRSNYKDYSIRDADITEENGRVTYTLRIRTSNEHVYVIFNPEGKILDIKNVN